MQHKNQFTLLWLTLIGLLLMLTSISACGVIAQEPVVSPLLPNVPAPQLASHTITVVASGQVPVVPDIAYLSLGVHTENEEVSVAVATNTRQVESLTQTLLDLGVAPVDIQTTSFNLWTMDQWSPEGQRTGQTYVVDNTVYVTLRELDQMGSLLDEVIAAGANSIFGIQFDVADKSAARAEARAIAVDNARLQAEDLAQAAGVTLGGIQSISFHGGGFPAAYYSGGMGGGGGYAAEGGVPVSSGQLQITAEVSIVYDLE